MTAAEIVKDYPPNIKAIAERFPEALVRDTVFAYGDKIYRPSGRPLSPQIIVHENIHCYRQREVGVEIWWEKYLSDSDFMYNEELLAHAGEYQFVTENASRHVRRASLQLIAQRLASPLYGSVVSKAKAEKDILNLIAA